MYFVQKPPKYSPSTTPLATKKSSAKLNSIFEFDSDEDDLFRASSAKLNSIFEFDSDEDDLFRASNVGSKHNLVNFCHEYIASYNI